jgi:hypothetical protein
VDVEFGSVGRDGAVVRAEMSGEGGTSFATLFARADRGERQRLLSSLHAAVQDNGSFEEVLHVADRSFRVRGRRSTADPDLIQATCEEIATDA